MSARRSLITGIAGQDGSLLAELLLAEGCEVVGTTHADPAAAAASPNLAAIADRIEIVHADLLAPEIVRDAIACARPDEVFHLAAPSFVPASWDDPTETFAAILGATAVVLGAAARADARVVVAASGEIFGDCGVSPQTENSPCLPTTPYGVAKLGAHHLVRIWRDKHGAHASSAVAYNHESERRPEQFVTRRITRGAAAIALGRSDELVLGDLDAMRDWSAARDIVRGFVLMARQEEPGDYVLASGRARTVRDVVGAAFGAAGVDPEGRVTVDPSFVRSPGHTPRLGDPSLARERLGWHAETTFEDLIAEMVRADLAELGAAPA